AKVLKAVEAVNESQKRLLSDLILAHFTVKRSGNVARSGKPLSGRTIAIWGLSFKPRTDDMREAPSVVIINNLLRAGAKIRAHDPVATREARNIFRDKIRLFEDSYETLRDADALAVVTEWNEFRMPDFDKIKKILKKPVIFDGRNIYNQEELKRMGFSYYGIGRR
ncbi:MAG TPA: UDP binding domain-containing protein, partial [Nitrospirota bacterium]